MSGKLPSRSWLTERRLRTHGLILGVALWSVYIWTLSTPGLRDRYDNLKGTDFLHFYTLGTLAQEHRGADLYDMQAQAQVAAQRVPPAVGIRYLPLYPPQVSMLFAPLATLSYARGLAVWWVVSSLLYAACCYSIFRACPNLRGHGLTTAILAGANPAFFHLISWGQTSALALICFTLMFFAVKKKWEFLAGVFLGCLVFKPQLALAPAIVFLVIGAWKVWVGSAMSAAAQLSIGVMYYGIAPLRAWLGRMWHVRSVLHSLEPRPYQTHCLRTFWSMLVPASGLAFVFFLISAIVVLAVTIAVWKRKDAPLALRFPALLLASVLVAPHLTVYDLVIFAPAFMLLADWLVAVQIARRSDLRHDVAKGTEHTGSLLYLVYFLPLIGPLARWTHVQLSVIAIGVLLYLIWKYSDASFFHPVDAGKVETCKN